MAPRARQYFDGFSAILEAPGVHPAVVMDRFSSDRKSEKRHLQNSRWEEAPQCSEIRNLTRKVGISGGSSEGVCILERLRSFRLFLLWQEREVSGSELKKWKCTCLLECVR